MIVSPTEPATIRALGHVSMLPESFGADVLIVPSPTLGGHVGVQRKEVKDLIASIHDGRLAEQITKMRGLAQAVLLVEGKIRWTNDGEMMGAHGRGLSRASFRGLLWSARKAGVWVDYTATVTETAEWLVGFEAWAKKEHHTAFETTAKGPARPLWGTVGNIDWQLHLLRCLPGVGPVAAQRIHDAMGMPLRMAMTREELLAIEGLGPAKVDRILAAVPTIERTET